MKLIRFFSLLLLTVAIAAAGCKKDENTGTCSDGIQNQGETGIDCGGPCSACKEGAHGTWHSFPVAPLLATFVDSINATFNTNNTYTVDQWKGGSKTVLSGTYIQTKSGTGNIYNITLNQTTPTTLTAEGIFEVYDNNTKMRYEVVQTTPAIGAGPATAAKGFGSSTFNGAALGNNNVQQYVRRK